MINTQSQIITTQIEPILQDRIRQISYDSAQKSNNIFGEKYETNFDEIVKTLIDKNDTSSNRKLIIYWVSRELRCQDNWSLITALEFTKFTQSELLVIYSLKKDYYYKNNRNYDFLTKSILDFHQNLEKLNIPFRLIDNDTSNNNSNIIELINNLKPLTIFTDFYPLNDKRQEKIDVISKTNSIYLEVDSHNIVPAWIASPKQEFGAYTLRPKIKKLLPKYLTDFPNIRELVKKNSLENENVETKQLVRNLKHTSEDIKELIENNRTNDTTTPSKLIIPSEFAAQQYFENFRINRLKLYNTLRNEPSKDGQSGLSPYLNYGLIANQRVAFDIDIMQVSESISEDKASFLEEQIVRRELSDNFTYYNTNYNKFEGFHIWAQTTLNEHRKDKREYIYTLEQFENAKTYDSAWNAAQKQLTETGRLHGYMRMYWAKKILEWSETPEYALDVAIYLNDYYALDGRDPNGFVGITWSIGGVHDRAWTERPIYGKIRYMNYNGLKRKFDIETYINQHLNSRKKLF